MCKHIEGGKNKKNWQEVGFRCVQSQVSANKKLDFTAGIEKVPAVPLKHLSL